MAGRWIVELCSPARRRLRLLSIIVSVPLALAACTTPNRPVVLDAAAVAPAAGGEAGPVGSSGWPEAGSCAALVRELAARDAATVRQLDPSTAPLVVASLGPDALAVRPDLPIPEVAPSAAAAAPCAILVGAAVVLPAATDDILDRRMVHSAYPSGTKRRRNPEHQALERELSTKRRTLGRVDVLATGDPLLDLIGTVVGGVIDGIGAVVKRSEVHAAETELATTPAFLEDPILTPYRYEVVVLEAERRLAMPIALYDRALGRTAETTVTLTEKRRFALRDGYHSGDAEPQHASEATPVSSAELAAWRRAKPPIATSTLLTHLTAVERTAQQEPESLASAVTRLAGAARLSTAMAEQRPAGDRDGRRIGVPAEIAAAVDAILFPIEPSGGTASTPVHRPPSNGLVRVGTDGRAGFYVTPEHVLAPAEALGHSSLLVVRYPDGMRAHGLVELVDQTLGLALVYLPRRGVALPLRVAASPAPAGTTEPGLPWRDGESVIGLFVTDPVTSGPRWIDSPTLDRFVARLDQL